MTAQDDPNQLWTRKIVRHADLLAMTDADSTHFQLVAPKLPEDAAVLRGHFSQVRLRDGLFLHATDAHELHDLETRSIQPPGLTFSIFLKGGVHALIGKRDFVFGQPPDQSQAQFDASAICRARSDIFVRHSRRGTHVRKVNITVSREWLENGGLDFGESHSEIAKFARTHLAFRRWRPSLRVVALAEQILRPPVHLALLQNLYLESRTIEIVSEALGVISASDIQPDRRTLRPRDYRRACQVCEFMRSNLPRRMTLSQLAREFAMSVNSLQRLFYAAHGTTVFDYLRSCRLERAREALERDGISVSEAAYMAGYTSAANFAAAFKRRFGISPRDVRTPV